MKELRQVVLGILAALLSASLLVGSLSMALLEGNMRQALAPTATVWLSPTLMPPDFTPSLTYTASTSGLTSTPTLTPIITATSTCNIPLGWIPITIAPGDTLEGLAATYNTTAQVLINGNCLPTNFLVVGNTLYVPPVQPTDTLVPTPLPTQVHCGPPPGWVLYTIRLGDTLYSLAIYFHVTVADLMFANCLTSYRIIAGETLYVPNLPTPTYIVPPTWTATRSPTLSPTAMPSVTNTIPPTPLPTSTSTPTPTNTETPFPPYTPTGTPYATPTVTSTPAPYPNVVLSWFFRLYHPGFIGSR